MFNHTCGFARALVVGGIVLSMFSVQTHVARASHPVVASQDAPVDTLEGVESAVVQIEAVGTFVDPSEGKQRNVPGFGSGFIIDPSGIAVTNNHVVTGGALFRVFVSGREEPVNARVLGVSECSDLAVIDLQGDGYPYVSWYEGRPSVGLDVYAAGFPLGEPEFALTRGIVSKSNADGESSWASLDSVLMHDATINPGNSGGPLVTADGKVVGVNYAGDDEASQYFAIPAAQAKVVVAELRQGTNVESLGLNGEAFDDGSSSGIWVYSVESGSPADITGVKPGDLIQEIEGIAVGWDGLLVEYCDILASHDSEDVLSTKVYRAETDETLEGQFNGRMLEPGFSIVEEVETGQGEASVEAPAGETVFVPLSDEAGIVHIETPEEWSDVKERDWEVDGKAVGRQLLASTDLEEFFDNWGIPGVVFSFSDQIQEEWTPEELLDTIDYSDACTYVGRNELPDDSFYTWVYDKYEGCGDSEAVAYVAAAVPETGDYMLGIEVYAASEADLAAMDHIIDTFYIETGSAPPDVANLGEDIFDVLDVEGLEYEYVFVNEPYFSAVLPESWDDVTSEEWVDEEDEENLLGHITTVADDTFEYQQKWDVPGVQAYLVEDAGADFDPVAALDAGDLSDSCDYEERIEHSHEIYGLSYSGAYDVYSDCENSNNVLYSAVMVEEGGDHAFIIDFVSMEEGDEEAWQVLLESFFLGSAVTAELNSEEYVTVDSEDGQIRVSVPNAWTDVESGPWEVDDEIVGTEMTVAPDVKKFNDSWDEPGLYVGVWEEYGEADSDEVLDLLTFEDECTYDARYEFDGEPWVGQYDMWTECGEIEGSRQAVFAVVDEENPEQLVVVTLVMPTQEDFSVLEPVLNTLEVDVAE